MHRVAVSVEGYSEEKFVKEILTPRFLNRGLCLIPINMKGDIRLSRVLSELEKLSNSFDFVTSLYDFYGFKEVPRNVTNGNQLSELITEKLSEKAQHKVLPYIQMYEFEALLFAFPEVSSRVLNHDENWFKETLRRSNNDPEKINNSPSTAPSKRLEAETRYKKTVDCKAILEQVPFDELVQKCSLFGSWIKKIDELEIG